MTKRDLLKQLLRRTGVLTTRWRTLSRRLSVFNFHRIGDRSQCPYNRDLFSCTADRFEAYLQLLSRRFKFVRLADVSAAAGREYRAAQPLALLTFDDGYLDNYTVCYPILRRLGIPAAFFVPTDLIGTTKLLWSDEIAWVLRHSHRPNICLDHLSAAADLVGPAVDPEIRRILRLVRRSPVPVQEQVEMIRAACGGVRPPAHGDRPAFMTWSQLAEMHADGMDIGSHTHTHAILARLSPAGQRAELQCSREILESRLGGPVRGIAYPVGCPAAYTAETCRLARAAGYQVGFNFRRHANRLPLDSPMDIGRFAVDDNPTPLDVIAMSCFPRLFAR